MKHILLILATSLLTSCASIKPYEQQHLLDEDMQISGGTDAQFKNYTFSIREGAMPTSNSKSSGGCGCN